MFSELLIDKKIKLSERSIIVSYKYAFSKKKSHSFDEALYF